MNPDPRSVNTPPTLSLRVSLAGLALLLVTQTGLLGWAATRHSPAIDEVGHLAAGLHHWRTGSLDLYRVNPPLVRLVATAPLVLLGVELPDDVRADSSPPWRPEFPLGRAFVQKHGDRSFWYFTLARWACVPFALLATTVIYAWGSELYGRPAGLVSVALWVICPNSLASGQMITPDTGATAFGLAASYLFWRWLRTSSSVSAIAAGATLGLALLCKFTCLLLPPLWLLLWVVYHARSPARLVRWVSQAGQLTLSFLIALYVLNAGYGFENCGTPLHEMRFHSQALTADSPAGIRVNRFAGTWLGSLPVPLPQNYLEGIDVQKRDFEIGMRSYLRGEWRTSGWWYYYLYGLSIKTPIGTLLVFVLAGVACLLRGASRPGWRDELVLLLPGVAVIGFVSSQTGFNHHLRYVLPGLPFLFIWAGRAVAYAGPFAIPWRIAAGVAVAVASVSSLSVYPHSLSYFHELSGGPTRGSEHLVDSNIDWGQDLLHLKEWYDQHPDSRPLHLAYFGHIDPRAAGIEFVLPPYGPVRESDLVGPEADRLGPRPGWHAVSVTLLRGYRYAVPNGTGGTVYIDDFYYRYFLDCQPVARAGYSINIYHLEWDECNRLRADLGLPPLRNAVPAPEQK